MAEEQLDFWDYNDNSVLYNANPDNMDEWEALPPSEVVDHIHYLMNKHSDATRVIDAIYEACTSEAYEGEDRLSWIKAFSARWFEIERKHDRIEEGRVDDKRHTD